MTPQPVPPHLIKPLSPYDVGIYEFEGRPARQEDERREAAWRTWTQSPNRVRRLVGRIAISRRLG
jgi:hypothetical protein